MTLRVDSTEIDDSGGNILKINGGKRRLYVRGGGFASSGFKLNVVVINHTEDAVEGARIKVYDIQEDDLSEGQLSVIIEGIDWNVEEKLAPGHRIIVVKNKDYNWVRGECVQNDANDNVNCAEFGLGIELAR
jgi:hypothetical protein